MQLLSLESGIAGSTPPLNRQPSLLRAAHAIIDIDRFIRSVSILKTQGGEAQSNVQERDHLPVHWQRHRDAAGSYFHVSDMCRYHRYDLDLSSLEHTLS